MAMAVNASMPTARPCTARRLATTAAAAPAGMGLALRPRRLAVTLRTAERGLAQLQRGASLPARQLRGPAMPPRAGNKRSRELIIEEESVKIRKETSHLSVISQFHAEEHWWFLRKVEAGGYGEEVRRHYEDRGISLKAFRKSLKRSKHDTSKEGTFVGMSDWGRFVYKLKFALWWALSCIFFVPLALTVMFRKPKPQDFSLQRFKDRGMPYVNLSWQYMDARPPWMYMFPFKNFPPPPPMTREDTFEAGGYERLNEAMDDILEAKGYKVVRKKKEEDEKPAKKKGLEALVAFLKNPTLPSLPAKKHAKEQKGEESEEDKALAREAEAREEHIRRQAMTKGMNRTEQLAAQMADETTEKAKAALAEAKRKTEQDLDGRLQREKERLARIAALRAKEMGLWVWDEEQEAAEAAAAADAAAAAAAAAAEAAAGDVGAGVSQGGVEEDGEGEGPAGVGGALA